MKILTKSMERLRPVKWLRVLLLILGTGLGVPSALAGEELIITARYKDGTVVPYILNFANSSPRYVIILFPGGTGKLNPRLEHGKLEYDFKGNFLIRSRKHIVDDEFTTVATDSTQSEERIQAVLDDIKNRFPAAEIYLMGTSRGTVDTMRLSKYLSDKVAGVIHTASYEDISSFDARKYKNRHLPVHHRRDVCRVTLFVNAEYSHKKYGNELIVMDGGTSEDDDCKAQAHHGFNGIEAILPNTPRDSARVFCQRLHEGIRRLRIGAPDDQSLPALTFSSAIAQPSPAQPAADLLGSLEKLIQKSIDSGGDQLSE